tara:strand:- start:93 stop:1091 length:999 start_codon:yes stop_codon:yes gene_type:complete
MIFKSYILEKKISTATDCKIFLFYGENNGLKKNFKDILRENYKNSEILLLLQEEILKNEDILINEILNKSLFKEEKIIFIEQSNDKILESIEKIVESINNEKIFIFSDILDKKSKLRNYFEKSKSLGISACYQDNEINIRKLILEKLSMCKGLTTEIVNLLIQNTQLDRNKINNEIDKILSFFYNKPLDLLKIEKLLNIRSNDDFSKLKDEALNGNKNKTNRLLADTVFEDENNIYYLNAINQRINKLKEVVKLKTANSNVDLIIEKLKPTVFWKDRPTLVNQAKKWNKNKIQKALNKTYKAEIELKSNAFIRKDLIIKNLVIEICKIANAS